MPGDTPERSLILSSLFSRGSLVRVRLTDVGQDPSPVHYEVCVETSRHREGFPTAGDDDLLCASEFNALHYLLTSRLRDRFATADALNGPLDGVGLAVQSKHHRRITESIVSAQERSPKFNRRDPLGPTGAILIDRFQGCVIAPFTTRAQRLSEAEGVVHRIDQPVLSILKRGDQALHGTSWGDVSLSHIALQKAYMLQARTLAGMGRLDDLPAGPFHYLSQLINHNAWHRVDTDRDFDFLLDYWRNKPLVVDASVWQVSSPSSHLDQGWLLTLTREKNGKATSLYVRDIKKMSEAYIEKARLQHRNTGT